MGQPAFVRGKGALQVPRSLGMTKGGCAYLSSCYRGMDRVAGVADAMGLRVAKQRLEAVVHVLLNVAVK
jgi:hypothetical protein